ncbi:MAG: amidohydrolase [Phycisphaerae bacterium]|nr:amidohydrolase [Phycisphaerae bacterium]
MITSLLCLPILLATAVSPDADTPADLILRNGTIVTVDDTLGTVQALAARGDRIVAVGDNATIDRHRGPGTTVVDLGGRLAIPGFIEGHGHFVGLGRAMTNLDLTATRSWSAIVSLVRAEAARAEPGEWILGRGWHQEKWDRTPPDAVRGFPTHHALSEAAPDNPVVLTHASGHASMANQNAMDRAGISASTADPPGGEILRDETGAPIGVFNERAQSLIAAAQTPADATRARAEMDRAIALATGECLKKGVTSFQDAGSSFETIEAFVRHARDGTLDLRLWVMIRDSNERLRERLPSMSIRNAGNHRLTVGGLKRTIDGALGSRGAWLLEPYRDDPANTGLATATVEDVSETAALARTHGLQLCVHAIGDRANREVLDLFERVLAGGPADHRWRIEHAQHLHPDDVPRFGRLGVIASMQGIHCTSDAPWVHARLGPERAASGAYVWRDLLDSGAVVTNGTDAPVEDVDPIASFHATVTRQLADGSVFYGDQRMTRMEALRAYTISNAFAAFEEADKGTLTPGKLADVAVLSKNILTVPESEIMDARVLMTIVGGRIVYQGGG